LKHFFTDPTRICIAAVFRSSQWQNAEVRVQDKGSNVKKRRLGRRLLRPFFTLLALVFALGGLACASAWTAMGQKPTGTHLASLERSPQFNGAHFENVLQPRPPDFIGMMQRSQAEKEAITEPEGDYAIESRVRSDFDAPPSQGVRVTWLGHSSMLVELDGLRVLTDPIWSERASPLSFMGPKRFHAPPLPLSELPRIDAVVISHDHYDHLDHATVVALAEKGIPFVVPLGIGSHLSYWGVPSNQIFELDWWQKKVFKNGLTLVSTPARHFSGRSGMHQDVTLWSSWAILGPEHRAFFSGDTAMHPDFLKVGERYGPFDVTLMENGAYNQKWADFHMGPEQAVQAHRMVRGRLLIPIHWGTFKLARHSWVEPAERISAAAEKAGVTVAIPRPGQMVEAPDIPALAKWWPQDVSWQRADEAPVVSSGLDENISLPTALPLLPKAPILPVEKLASQEPETAQPTAGDG
jgi:L-ascorbate metabolism protein UlaG (beta-lactamase superfamily)